MPDSILPQLHYSLDTIGTAVEAYEDSGKEPDGEVPCVSYRSVALAMTGDTVPPGFTLTGYLGGFLAAPLGPSHIFRWVDRFSAGADQWLHEIAVEAQDQIGHALSPPSAPESIKAKGRSPEKRQHLADAWVLLWVLRFLLSLLGRPTSAWPYALVHPRKRPLLLDHTGWFAVRSRAPP